MDNIDTVAVLWSISSQQIQCFRLSGGLLDSTGWLLVVKLWHVIHLSFTGTFKQFFFDFSFFFKHFSASLFIAYGWAYFAGFVLHF
jgi:hypothetical protein